MLKFVAFKSSNCPYASNSWIRNRVKSCAPGNTIKAFAKIVVKDQKNYMSFGDSAGDHIKEIVFPGVQDLKRFRIQLLNAYGQLIDMTNTNFSMSLELLEIKNMNLHAAIRDSLSLRWIGAGNEQNNAYRAPG
jgi:hypothetical protein